MTTHAAGRRWGIAALCLLVGLAWSARAARAAETRAPEGAPRDPVTVDSRIDAVIRGGLRFLASRQMPSGAWSEQGGQHQAAITGYVLMTFMAAGNLPGEGEYGRNVARGTQFLLDCVRPDGFVAAPTGESNMYGHGIATIALGELYGQTRNPAIRAKLERAIKLIVNCQNDQGGWRYQPQKADADISVTVLQVVALRAAKNAGLEVPQKTIDKAVAYVRSCYDPKARGFCYQPHSGAGFARTAAAIYSLQVCGLYDDPMVRAGSQYLLEHQQKHGFAQRGEWFTYGNFYAAPAQYMIGGESWRTWYATISKSLLGRVKREGEMAFWDPLEGGQGVGPVYATAVYTMILAVPYHYVPLYQR